MRSLRRHHAEVVQPLPSQHLSPGSPHPLVRAARQRSGLELLTAICAGQLDQAPFFETVGTRIVEVEHGRAVFEGRPGSSSLNLIGTVHGGWLATLLDSACGCAVYSTLSRGDRWTTVNLTVDYVRPLTEDAEPVRCVGRVVRVGRRIGLADATLTDAEDRLIARARSTCMIIRDDGR